MEFEKLTFPEAELLLAPQFLELKDADALFDYFQKHIAWEQLEIKIFGKLLPQPRLSAFYASQGVNYAYSGLKLKPRPFDKNLEALKTRIEEATGYNFNSCLANLYRDGKDSMGWHADDEKELGKNSVIASLSLGAVRNFQMKHKTRALKHKIDLQHGSLLIMQGEMQHYWKHQLPKTARDIGPRINLTFRNIIN